MNRSFLLIFTLFVQSSSLWAQSNTAQPVIHLRAAVDQLRLRAQANKNAAVVAVVAENEQLTYLGETGGAMENITLRGVAHRARWYKVRPVNDPDKTGWVYGGAVTLSSVFLPDGVSPGTIREDFLQIYPIRSEEFDDNQPPAGLLRDTAGYMLNEHAIRLPFKDGSTRILADTISADSYGDGENDLVYTYQGRLEAIDQYVVEKTGYEWNVMQFWNRKNGQLCQSLDYPLGLPSLSPDAHWVALAYADPYETLGGLQFFWADSTGLYPAFNIQQNDRTAEGYWQVSSGEFYFRWAPIMSGNEAAPGWYRMRVVMQ
ncbi:MAG TPA: SH3 domain-containing protein [Saprospiraceae bacterium]|nr:SH3 domain-containing protein [Saprospiraceae bacterium]